MSGIFCSCVFTDSLRFDVQLDCVLDQVTRCHRKPPL